jgi:hypothetical protein
MSRTGIRTLFNEIIAEDYPLKLVKGRSERLDDQRNECLITRYLYMMKLTGWRLDLLKKMIASDFFLSERTVLNILDDNYAMLRSIRNNMPDKTQLEKKWPQYNWSMPELSLYS